MKSFTLRHLFVSVVFLLGIINISTAQNMSTQLEVAANGFMKSCFLQSLKSCTLIDAPTALLNESGEAIAYVFGLSPVGYIVLAPEKGMSPIIAFSTESNFVFEENENNTLLSLLQKDMSGRLARYKQQQESGKREILAKNIKRWDQLMTATSTAKNYATQYGPYCPSTWGGVNCVDDQGNSIYVGNYYTPSHYSPGCVASSTSTVMHFYEWPTRGMKSHTDHDNYGSSQGSYYANFAATNYDWGNMLNEYYAMPSNDTEQRAMGLLAYHCGIAFDMEYENHGSTSNVNRTPAALDKYFRYTAHYESVSWGSFWTRVEENLQNSHPVTFAISATNGAGHATACDGYGQDAGQPKFYHMHFGWWGTSNGWYDLHGSWNGGGYSIIDGGALDILPDPMMSEPIRGGNEKVFDLPWLVSNQLTCDAFEIQESRNGGPWTILDNNYNSQTYNRTVTQNGNYKYKVRAKIDGHYYFNSFSENQEVLVARDDNALVSLDFDGNDSFFANDNAYDDLDVSNEWTFETWVKVNNFHPTSDFDVIMDRRTVFSMYLISDNNADYAIRFVSRASNGNYNASLRSDNSSQNLNFGDWVHVAATRTGGVARLFINGQLVDSSVDADFALTPSTNAINFGARYWGSYDRHLVGELDEIRISNTARYTSSFSPSRSNQFSPDANTVLLLHLDEGSGNSLGDHSRHFFDTNLRDSPNAANWVIEQALPIAYSQPLTLIKEKKKIVLAWATNLEKNNQGFEIQKSKDSKNWTKIGWVEGKGKMSTSYRFPDEHPYLGINLYRLKQIDKDGKTTFSKIVSASYKQASIMDIYPNPVANTLNLKTPKNREQPKVILFNYSGKSINIHWLNNTQIDVSQLPAGIYYINIELENRNISEKIVVTR